MTTVKLTRPGRWRASGAQGVDVGAFDDRGWLAYRPRRCVARRSNGERVGPSCDGTVDAGHVPAGVHASGMSASSKRSTVTPSSGRGPPVAARSTALVIDIDSTICEVAGKAKGGAGYGYTKVLGYHPILATRADTGEVLHARMRKGSKRTPSAARDASSTKSSPESDAPAPPVRSTDPSRFRVLGQ